ncbi:MAG TPA: GvpL/GvpF family gas vesicle protein [Solirubrobacterales bacterium]|nr:GvpL/GvpF family gas vesicle protein [Solirubrobacterales bacterium]
MSGVLYIYAIADSPATPTGTGLHGAPLRRIRSGRLAALISEHPRAPEPDEEVLWAHEQVVEELMSSGTVLPLRFGSSVERGEDLMTMLAERREEFMDALERVRGAVELSVRAELPVMPSAEAPLPRPRSGTAYLMERAEQERRERSAVELVHRPLAALARDSVAPALTHGVHQFKAAYLVDAGRVEDFGSRVGELNADLEGTRVTCTGPWPPYSFVTEGSR